MSDTVPRLVAHCLVGTRAARRVCSSGSLWPLAMSVPPALPLPSSAGNRRLWVGFARRPRVDHRLVLSYPSLDCTTSLSHRPFCRLGDELAALALLHRAQVSLFWSYFSAVGGLSTLPSRQPSSEATSHIHWAQECPKKAFATAMIVTLSRWKTVREHGVLRRNILEKHSTKKRKIKKIGERHKAAV